MVRGLLSASASFAATGVLALLAPSSLRRWRQPVPVVAVLFAVAGALADPAPTGVAVLDALFRAALCGGTVLLGASRVTRAGWRRRVNRWAVVAAAALAFVAAGPSSLWLAGAGLGLAVGAAAARFHAPVITALAAGLTTQAALRLGWPTVERGSAIVAGVVFAVLIGAGWTALPRRPRRRVVRAAGAALAAAGVVSFLGLLAAAEARPAMENGIRTASAGLDEARSGSVEGSGTLLASAARSFAAAQRQVDAWWARPALAVPVVAQHIRALRAMTASGATLSSEGARAAGVAELGDLRLDRGAVPIRQIAAFAGLSGRAHSALTAAEARLQPAASPWLLPVVSTRLADLSGRVKEARGAAQAAMIGSRVAPALLGADGPRHYFLAVLTPSELRGSGGLLASFGEISADEGRLRLDRVGRIGELISAGDPNARRLVGAPPDYVDRYARFEVSRLLQDTTLSPDFPSVARVISGLYPQSGGRPVDGVVAIDPIGVAGLLKVLGPVQVRQWPVPITGENAAQILLFDQYVRFQGDERVDFLTRVTQAVWQRLTTSTPNVVQLARTLGPLVAEKHLQLASTHPPEQRALLDLGAAGAMDPVRGDFLGVVTQNSANNKIDWFLRRSIDYEASIDAGSGALEARARITLRNGAPASGLPPYIIGNSGDPPLPVGTNRLYLSVYTPWLLTSAKADGQPLSMSSERELGRRVYSAYVSVPPGASLTVELELEGRLDPRHAYRLDLHRQPFLAPDQVKTSLRVLDESTLGAVGGRYRSQRLQLSSDRSFEWG